MRIAATVLMLLSTGIALPAHAGGIWKSNEKGVQVYRGSPINTPRIYADEDIDDITAYIDDSDTAQEELIDLNREIAAQSAVIGTLEDRIEDLEDAHNHHKHNHRRVSRRYLDPNIKTIPYSIKYNRR